MNQMLWRIPPALASLPSEERDALVRAGVRAAIQARLHQLEKEIAEATAQVAQMEARYDMPLARFETERLPDSNTPQAHMDYITWFFWQSVLEEKQRLLIALEPAGVLDAG